MRNGSGIAEVDLQLVFEHHRLRRDRSALICDVNEPSLLCYMARQSQNALGQPRNDTLPYRKQKIVMAGRVSHVGTRKANMLSFYGVSRHIDCILCHWHKYTMADPTAHDP